MSLLSGEILESGFAHKSLAEGQSNMPFKRVIAVSATSGTVKLCNLRAGRPAHYATVPVMRVHGPSNLLLDVHGNTIQATSKLHPHGGQGKRIVPWLDYGEIW